MEPAITRLRAGSKGKDGLVISPLEYYNSPKQSIYRVVAILLPPDSSRDDVIRKVKDNGAKLGLRTTDINHYPLTCDAGPVITFAIHRVIIDDMKETDAIQTLIKDASALGTVLDPKKTEPMRLPADLTLLTHSIVILGPAKHKVLTELSFTIKTLKNDRCYYFMPTLDNAQAAIKFAPPLLDSLIAYMDAHVTDAGFYLLTPTAASFSEVVLRAASLKTELFGIWPKSETAQKLIMLVRGDIHTKLSELLKNKPLQPWKQLGVNVSKLDVNAILAKKLRQEGKPKKRRDEPSIDELIL
jgi:hypothetical protein